LVNVCAALYNHGCRQRGLWTPPGFSCRIADRGLIVRLFGIFLLFFGLFFVAPPPSGRSLIVLFFGLFYYFSVFFSVAPSGNFSVDTLVYKANAVCGVGLSKTN